MYGRILLLLSLAALALPPLQGGTAETEVKASSPFKTFDLKDVGDGQILESRAGASLSPRIESVQTCFVMKESVAAAATRILNWNPVGKKELGVASHQKLQGEVSSGTFKDKLALLFGPSADQGSWIVKQSKMAKDPSGELILAPEEKAKLAAASNSAELATAWAALLAKRYDNFRKNGAPDFQSLLTGLKTIDPGAYSSPGSDSIYYWEIGDVSNHAKISESVSWSKSNGNSTDVIDGEFFVSSEYSASLNVSRLWSVSVDSKPATLVWRIDLAFANEFADQNGAERIAAAGLILSSTKKTIMALQEIKK